MLTPQLTLESFQMKTLAGSAIAFAVSTTAATGTTFFGVRLTFFSLIVCSSPFALAEVSSLYVLKVSVRTSATEGHTPFRRRLEPTIVYWSKSDLQTEQWIDGYFWELTEGACLPSLLQ